MPPSIRFSEADGITNLEVGDRRLTLHLGDVLELKADAVVCPVDSSMNLQKGFARVITEAAGAPPPREQRYLQEPFGKVVVYPGGDLKAKYIFFTVLLGERGLEKIRLSIHQAVDRAIHYAEFLRLKSIAFPLLGSALETPPYELVAKEMLEEVALYLGRRKTRLKFIAFSLLNPDAFGAFKREAQSLANL